MKQKLFDNKEQAIYLCAVKYVLTRKTVVVSVVIDEFIKHIDKFDTLYLIMAVDAIKEKIIDCSEKDSFISRWEEFLKILENKIKEKDGKK